MKNIKRILVSIIISALVLISVSPHALIAMSDVDEVLVLETFIQGINDREKTNITIDDLLNYSIENEVVTIVISDGNDGVISYRSLSNGEQENLQNIPQTRGIITEFLKYIWGGISKVYKVTKFVCKVVEVGTGDDVCGMIGQAMWETLVPNVRYKVESYLVKNPNCSPPHSQQCNTAPNVYWKTFVTRY